MKKAVKIILLSVLVVVIALGFIVYNAAFATATRTAYLMIDQGSIEVDSGDGWEAAEDLMDLGLNDKIRTNDGKATIVFYDSVIITLEPNTEISIMELSEEHVQVGQESGSTWHKFTKVVGIEDYKVNTHRAVATIRGTMLGVEMGDNETFRLIEGEVELQMGDEILGLEPMQMVVISEDGSFEVMDIDLEKQDLMLHMGKNLVDLKNIRKHELDSHQSMIDRAYKKYNAQKSVDEYLDDIDSGVLDDNMLLEKSPVKLPAMTKLKALNDEIKKAQWMVRQIDAGASGEEIRSGIQDAVYLQ